MAYRKVCDTQGGPLVAEVLRCSGGLDLDWDLDKEELQEPGPDMERLQMQHVDCQRSGGGRFHIYFTKSAYVLYVQADYPHDAN